MQTSIDNVSDKKLGTPWLWVPTLYVAEGIPFFIVTFISVTLFKQLGMPNAPLALFTSLISFPWIIKPLWSPFVDVIKTKRWWIITMQALMVLTTLLIALLAPRGYFAIGLILFTITAFASATHDIAADGFYMIALNDKQQSAFVGIRSVFYKLASIYCQAFLLVLVGWLEKSHSVSVSWQWTLLSVSALLAVITLWHSWQLPRTEPLSEHKAASAIWKEIGLTFVEFFRKPGIALALTFMLLYRLPEALLLKLCTPFFLDSIEQGGLGLTADQIGIFYGGFGVVMMLLGGILGGLAGSKWGLKRMIIWMCLFLTLPCIVYCYMAIVQPTNLWIISACVGFEQFGYGIGYTACMLFMMQFAKGEHKTAHFSICTAIMYLGLMLPGLVAGYLQEWLGYTNFFWLVMVCCIPSIAATYLVYRNLDKGIRTKE